MNTLTDASHKILALFELLRSLGELELIPEVRHTDSHPPGVVVELTGADAHMLSARDGELLYALEHLTAEVLRVHPEEHHRVSFDTGEFKARRDAAMQALAQEAVATVYTTGRPYVFKPMHARARRLLHLALTQSGMKSASSGDLSRRAVILYPLGVDPPIAIPRSTRRPDPAYGRTQAQ